MPPTCSQHHAKISSARDITERPRAPSGVAAFMSAHSKTPYITPSMDFSSGNGVVRGRSGQQLEFAVSALGGHVISRAWQNMAVLRQIDTMRCSYSAVLVDTVCRDCVHVDTVAEHEGVVAALLPHHVHTR